MKRVTDDGIWISPEERQEMIFRKVNETGRIVAAEFARELNISEDTVRRDLRVLVEAGLVQRFYGGARRLPQLCDGFFSPVSQGRWSGSDVALAAARAVPDGATLIVGAGAYCRDFVQCLPVGRAMRIVTSSVDVAAAALDHQGSEVVLLGGTLNKSTRSAIGFAATDAIREVRADIGIISNVCIDEDMHLRASDYDIAQLNACIIEASKNVLVLVKAEELGSDAVHFIAALGAKSTIVTDARESALLAALRERGVNVQTVRTRASE